MLELLFFIFGLVVFFEALLLKFNFYDKFREFSFKSSSKIIYRLSNCEFCMRFWLTSLVTSLVFFLRYFNLICFLIPFIVCGYLIFLENDSKN